MRANLEKAEIEARNAEVIPKVSALHLPRPILPSIILMGQPAKTLLIELVIGKAKLLRKSVVWKSFGMKKLID